MAAGLGADVRESKKVERVRAALTAALPAFDRMSTELDQARLLVVEFQAKLGKPCAEFLQTRSRLVVMLETDHEIIRKAHYHDIAAAVVFTPPLDPKVKDIMEVHIRK